MNVAQLGTSLQTPLIALLTDFGQRDGFVGVMKGVIHGILKGPVSIVDLSHDVDRHNIWHAAWVLGSAVPYFPRDSVFCCVVDPNVGHPAQAKLLAIWPDRWQFFVAPDNGLLTPVFQRAGKNLHVRRIENQSIFNPASQTFHGRDIYAPTAAYLANALSRRYLDDFLNLIGPVTREFQMLDWHEPTRRPGPDGTALVGQIVHSDIFGNLITNIPSSWLTPGQNLRVGLGTAEPFHSRLALSYTEGGGFEDAPLFVIPSSGGTLEISKCQASAAHVTGAKPGDAVTLLLS